MREINTDCCSGNFEVYDHTGDLREKAYLGKILFENMS
jgi:hypothetical protein